MSTPDPELFAEIALELEQADADTTVERVIEVVQGCVPCDGASIMLVHGRRIELSAASGDDAAEADRVQVEIGAGPSLEVLNRPEAFILDDITTSQHWQDWAARAADLGWRSALSVRIRTQSERIGSLNLFAHRTSAFDEDDAAVAAIFADHAAVAIAAAHTELGLRRAIDARHVIGQAQGILMERFGIDADRAFSVLRRYSQDKNIRLRAVAETLVESRALPGQAAPTGADQSTIAKD